MPAVGGGGAIVGDDVAGVPTGTGTGVRAAAAGAVCAGGADGDTNGGAFGGDAGDPAGAVVIAVTVDGVPGAAGTVRVPGREGDTAPLRREFAPS
jgi:hypothetical protein